MEVDISKNGLNLPGILNVPVGASGLVIFAHGSGSGRLSPRNQHVARLLNRAGLGTLLLDLLTPHESREHSNVFNIELLAQRLIMAIHWVKSIDALRRLSLGFFGASTGAAAALWAAAELGEEIEAVVSRGGRPDLALPRLTEVHSPTLLLVGSRDEDVLDFNQDAIEYLNSIASLIIIPGATHLFEEPGMLNVVADEAITWFLRFLSKRNVEHSAPAWM